MSISPFPDYTSHSVLLPNRVAAFPSGATMGHGLPSSPALTTADRYLILATAFLGWLCAGFLLATTSLAMLPAALDLLHRVGTIDATRFDLSKPPPKDLPTPERELFETQLALSQRWFAFYTCAFLFGAASGGFLFGRLGDRIGRTKAMAASILCYSLFSGACYFVQTPIQLLLLWYFACLGVGGTWPNGVALAAESWSSLSRPLVAGLLGTSANVGLFGLSTLGTFLPITPDTWRWMILVCAAPMVLALLVLAFVRESPRWLATRSEPTPTATAIPINAVFRSPLLSVTLVGIALATIPMFGGWGSANWMVPWAGDLKAKVSQYRSLSGMVGSLLGGWVAHTFGRRLSYCLVSLSALVCAQYTFWCLVPTSPTFFGWVAALGFFSGIYFGWMPLCLPELFPTRSRATGAGVCFNFGRVLTAVNVFATGALIKLFEGDYASIGKVTSLCFALGAVLVWLAPDTSRRDLED